MEVLRGGGKTAPLDARDEGDDVFQSLIMHLLMNSGYESCELMPEMRFKFFISLITTPT